MGTSIAPDRLKKYFTITEEALRVAQESNEKVIIKGVRLDFLDMIKRYIADAHHFHITGDDVNAFAALNYAHGWLDAGARIGIFDVHDSRLFTVDEKTQ